MNVTWNLGVIRRTIINDLLGDRKDLQLNYTQHSTPQEGIAQLIWPKTGTKAIVEALRKRDIACLPENYDPPSLPARIKHIWLRRKKALEIHQAEVLRNWEKCESNPRMEDMAELFDELLDKVRKKLGIKVGDIEDEEEEGAAR